MRLFATLALAVAPFALSAGPGVAQIERLSLEQMVQKTDGAVLGKIVQSKVFRVDHPQDGRMYFTTLTIRGRALGEDRPLTVEVTFPGGFVSPDEGVWNSEAPTAEETRVGNRVVAFYRWIDDMGGGVAANALYASHGGLYQVQRSRRQGDVVLGRGVGYALCSNCPAGELGEAVRRHRAGR